MTTLAIVGAGRGPGVAVARRFGAEGHCRGRTGRGDFRVFAQPM
jgi:hypothetical protein